MEDFKFKWSSKPETTDPVIRLFRNYCSSELSAELVYPEGPTFRDWTIAHVMDWMFEHATPQRYNDMVKIYRLQTGMFPFSASIHEFLRKYDKDWYNEVYEANYKHKV